MDFKAYYLNQALNGLPSFQGSPYQRRYGLGGIYLKIFRYIVKEHALPVAKNLGKDLLKTATNVANDAINGEDVGESAKKRFRETLKNYSDKIGFHEGQGLKLKPGLTINSHKKNKKSFNKQKKKIKKRILDIFDRK